MATDLSGSGTSSCACCGVTADDDGINLKLCTACKLVRYCGVTCQKEHRRHHKQECKKRMAELRDEILFRQPESSHLGDCPICFLPIPLQKYSTFTSCCRKLICKGCSFADLTRMNEARQKFTCLFCRQPHATSLAEENLRKMKRAEANDPIALREVAGTHYDRGDYSNAFDCFTKAAKLGDAKSHYHLSIMYFEGHGVEKNKTKEIYHMEEAAIGGHVVSRFNLGMEEISKGDVGRAVKHFIIAANQGDDDAIEKLREMYASGLVTKGEFAAALRAHQTAVDATKSPLREKANCKSDAWKAAGRHY